MLLASFPGLPVFFNVMQERSGRPGQFYDVMMTYWTRFGTQFKFSAYLSYLSGGGCQDPEHCRTISVIYDIHQWHMQRSNKQGSVVVIVTCAI